MKTKLIFLIIFSLCSIFSFAQLQRGTWLLDGNANAITELHSDLESYGFSIALSAGYAFSNRWLIGARVSTSYTVDNQFLLDNRLKFNFYSFTPFARYYFSAPEKTLKLFATIDGGWQLNKGRIASSLGESEFSSTYYFIRGGVGAGYFIAPSIAIEGGLGYLVYFFEAPANTEHNLGLQLGLRFFLPKQKNSDDTPGIAVEKGALYIAYNPASIYASWGNIGKRNDLNFEISPTLGYFLTNRFVLGTGLFVGFANQNRIVDLSPFVRYYFGTQSIRFQPFATVSTSTRFQFADKSSEANFFNLDVNGGVGADFFLTRNVALEGILQFNGNQIEDEVFNRNYLNFNIGLQFFLNN